MIIRDTKDIELIKSILCHPEIYKRIGNDDAPSANKFEPPLNVQYLAGFVNNAIMGLGIYIHYTGFMLFHFQVLPEYRENHAKMFARMTLDHREVKNARIYTEIPQCHPDVMLFALSIGFTVVGGIIKGRKKNGTYHDVAILRLKNGICQ